MNPSSPFSKHRFDAPWSKTLIFITVLSCGVAVGIVLLAGFIDPPKEDWVRWLVMGLAIVGLPLSALFGIRGYQLEGRQLLINRPLWNTAIPLDELRETTTDPDAMRGCIRLCGDGGLFSFTGWYRSKRLGTYRAFATDPARSVVLTFPRRTIVVTPADPDAFVQALIARHA